MASTFRRCSPTSTTPNSRLMSHHAMPSLLRPNPDWPEGLEFDIRQRYTLTAQLLDRLCSRARRPLRLLEVGSNVLNLLPGFFDADLVHVTRCDLLPEMPDDPNYVRVEADRPLPFADGAFDAVACLEVLEHIPADGRLELMRECLRVSRCGVVWSCPNGIPEVVWAEVLAGRAYQRRNGQPHPFLGEHRAFGLPSEAEIRGYLQTLEVPFAVFSQTPLDVWTAGRLLVEPLAERAADADLMRQLEEALRRFSHTAERRGVSHSIPYRKIYVAAKCFEATDALELPSQADVLRHPLESATDGDPLAVPADPQLVRQLAEEVLEQVSFITDRVLAIAEAEQRSLLKEKRHWMSAYAIEKSHIIAWHARTRILDELVRTLSTTWSSRLVRPFRAVARKILATKADERQLIPWCDVQIRSTDPQAPIPAWKPNAAKSSKKTKSKSGLPTWQMQLSATKDSELPPYPQLVENRGLAPVGALWESIGHDPQFLLPCLIPAGWARIRLQLEGSGKGIADIYADYGDGFTPATCIESVEWVDQLTLDFVIHLPKVLRGLRLDPLKAPGVFRICSFSVQSLPPLAAFWDACRRKRDLLSSYRCTWPALWRGLSLLIRGEFRQLWAKLFKAFPDDRKMGAVNGSVKTSYDAWRRARALTDSDRRQMRQTASQWTNPPLISVILPVYKTPLDLLQKAIDSVRNQLYPHWQLCIVDDGSQDPKLANMLRQYASQDSRICVRFSEKNGGISAASNLALADARGDFIALLDHDDELAEQALFRVAEAIRAHPQADFFYSDEDKLEVDGRHTDPFFKPQWTPEYFLTCMYTCHLGVYRTSLVRELGGFRSEYDLAQDYDLALRIVSHIQSRTRRADGTSAESEYIRHIPDVLYHWRKTAGSTALGHEAKPKAEEAARRAVQDYLNRQGRGGVVSRGPSIGLQRVRYPIVDRPKISIVIPTAGKEALLGGRPTWFVANCVESIRQKSTYDNYEILVIDNDDLCPVLQRRLDQLGVIRVPFTEPFNLARKMNLGATKADGDYLLLLNDDIEVISPDWMEAMLEWGQWPEIGAVGARLYFENGLLQHAGVTLIRGVLPSHHFYKEPGDHPGYWASNLLVRNYSAVTGACMLTRTRLYHELGGFDPAFPLNFNDVDYCMRLTERGYRIVYQPNAELFHFESVSKEGCFQHEIDQFVARWQHRWKIDPMYSPHLTQRDGDFRIGLPDERQV